MKKIKDYLLFLKQRFYAYRRAVKLDQKIIIAITVMTAAIIIVLAWIIRPNPKIEIAATQLAQTANNIRLFYQTKPGYWGLNTETVIKNNLEAGGMLIDGKLQNAFGKPVIIGEDEQGSIIMPGTRHFTVTFPELNKSECTVMAAFRLNERESLEPVADDYQQPRTSAMNLTGAEAIRCRLPNKTQPNIAAKQYCFLAV